MELLALDQHHIPLPATSLVGRSRELAEVMLALGRPDVRLVTLTGPGGVGKTRLALQVAHDIDPDKAGEIAFVPLAAVSDGESVLPAIARAIGVRQIESIPLEKRLIDAIDSRRMLLILDNAEHVADHLTALSSLLNHCQRLKILVTSTVMLRLSAEIVLPVEPLTTTSAGPDALAPASALFVERARAVRHDLALTRENLLAIDEICRQLDGLPLAIELAAARTRFLSPTALRDRLSERLPVLVGGPRDAPERHQTLRATLTWSHGLLTDDERVLFRRLAIFRGSAPLDAVEPVCNADGALGHGTEGLLGSLVDHSLVRIVEVPAVGPRVRLLNIVREFALEELGASGEADAVAEAHARWFCHLTIDTPQEHWRTGTPELRTWTLRHEPDLDNLAVALERVSEWEDKEPAIRLVTNLVSFWLEVGVVREGREWTQRLLPYANATPLDVRGRFLYIAATMALVVQAHEEALELAERAVTLCEEAGETRLAANALNLIGTIHWSLGNAEDGERMQMRAVETMRASSDPMRGGMFLATIGENLIEHGQVERGEALLREGLELVRQERPEAVPLFQGTLANLALDRSALDEAGELLEQSLAYHRNPPHPQPIALTDRLCIASELAVERGRPEDAARLVGVTMTIIERTGMIQHSQTKRMLERVHERLDPALDTESQARAMRTGRMMSVPDAIELALEIARMRTPAATPTASQDGTDDGLTRRQREILALLAEGKSNAAIADALFISERTVTTHLTRIYDRLDVSTRTEAVARAAQMGLIPSSRT